MDNLVQGTPEWRSARAGSLGASQVAEALSRVKSGGWGAGRANVMAQLLTERLTGTPSDCFVNAAMQHGTDTEPQARSLYSFAQDVDVVEVGLVRHPTIKGTHASPDGLVGRDGLVEIKCPTSATHLDTLLGASVPGKYVTQMMWQMACTGRQFCDFVSYDPRMPVDLQLFICRVPRDDAMVAELEAEVRAFLTELDAKIGQLTALRQKVAA